MHYLTIKWVSFALLSIVMVFHQSSKGWKLYLSLIRKIRFWRASPWQNHIYSINQNQKPRLMIANSKRKIAFIISIKLVISRNITQFRDSFNPNNTTMLPFLSSLRDVPKTFSKYCFLDSEHNKNQILQFYSHLRFLLRKHLIKK